MKANRIVLSFVATIAMIALIFCFCGCNNNNAGGKLQLVSFTVDRTSVKTNYLIGEAIDFSGIRATAKYSDETLNKEYTFQELTITYADDITATVGEKEVVVSFEDPNLNVKQEAKVKIKVTAEHVIEEVDPLIVVQFEKPSSLVTFDNNNRNAGKTQYGQSAFASEFLVGNKTYVIGNESNFKLNPSFAVLNEDDAIQSLETFYATVEVSIEKEGSYVKLTKNALEGNHVAYYDGETLIVTVDTYNGNYDFTTESAGAKVKIEVMPSEDFYILDDVKPVTLEAEIIQAYNVYEAWQMAVVEYDSERTDWVDLKTQYGLLDVQVSGIVLHNDIKITAADVPSSFFYTTEKAIEYKNAATGEKITVPAGTLFLKEETFLYQRVGATEFVIQGNFFNLNTSGFPLVASPEVFGANAGKDYETDFSNSALFYFKSVDEETMVQHPTGIDVAEILIENMSIIGNAKRDNLVDAGDNLVSAGGLIFAKNTHMTKTTINNVIGNSYFITYFVAYGAELHVNSAKCYDSYQNAAYAYGRTVLTITDSYLNGCGGPVLIAQCRIDDNMFPVNVLTNTVAETHVTGEEIWFTAVNATTLVGKIQALGAGLEAAGLGNFVDRNGKMNIHGALMPTGHSADEVVSGVGAQGSLEYNGAGINRFQDNENWSMIFNHPAFLQGAAFLTVTDAEGNCYTVYNIGTEALYDMYGNQLGTDPSHAAILKAFMEADSIVLSQGGISIVFEFYHNT